MDTLDVMKEEWSKKSQKNESYHSTNLFDTIRQRMRMDTRESMKYFWASLALQILVYALYAHVIVKHFNDPATVILSALGIVAYIPFTHMLLNRFKQLAIAKPTGTEASPVRDYIGKKRDILRSFFRFKRRYELFLIPVSTLFGTLLVFKLYVPGGPIANPNGMWITMAITLIACFAAIRNENIKSFYRPIAALDKLLAEFSEDAA